MNRNYTSAGIKFNIDIKDAYKELNAMGTFTERRLEGMKSSAEAFNTTLGDLTRGIKDTKRIVSGIMISQAFYTLSSSITNVTRDVFNFSRGMEAASVSMEYFIKSADRAAKAQAYLLEINRFAARTPFTTEQTLALSRYMQTVGMSIDVTRSFFTVMADAAAATGGTEEQLNRAVVAMGRMRAKGRITNMEIRQLAAANIPIYQILQEQLGLTGEQVANLGKYWVDADKAIVAILRGLEERYEGAADRMADTVNGMFNTLKDNTKILGQVLTENMYADFREHLGNFRDALAEYREVAIQSGSQGLIHQVLLDLDSTGELGTRLLALVGDVRNLGGAFKDLYISSAPIRRLFGDTLHASIKAVTIGTTTLTSAVDGTMKALDKLGITGGKTGASLASLYITYKAGEWLAFLGQSASAAAMRTYDAAVSISHMLPASLQARTGIVALTMGLGQMILYLAAASYLTRQITSSFTSMGASTTDIFPDDYMDEFNKYQEAYRQYYAEIEKYEQDFTSPFTEIADGADDAVDGLEDIRDASKKTAKAVKDDWLASFDEVYTIPKQVGKELDELARPDFGLSLLPPTFKFPSFDAIELDRPRMDWENVFKKSPFSNLDSDVLKPDWWKRMWMLPMLGIMGTIYGRRPGPGGTGGRGTGGTGGTGGTAGDPNFKSAKDNVRDMKEAVREMLKKEDEIQKILDRLAADGLTPEVRRVLMERLARMTSIAERDMAKIDAIRVALEKTSPIESTVLELAKKIVSENELENLLSKYVEALARSYDTGPAGAAAIAELRQIRGELRKAYNAYVSKYGTELPEHIANNLKQVISTGGLEQRISDVGEAIQDLSNRLEANGYDTKALATEIATVNKELNSISKEILDRGLTGEYTKVPDMEETIRRIKALETSEKKLERLNEDLTRIADTLEDADARAMLGEDINRTVLREEFQRTRDAIDETNRTIGMQRNLLKYSDEEIKVMQQMLNAQNRFNNVFHKLNRIMHDIADPLQALKKYSSTDIRDFLEGKYITDDISSGTYFGKLAAENEQFEQIFLRIFGNLVADAGGIRSGRLTDASKVVDNFMRTLIGAMHQVGREIGVSQEYIQKAVDTLVKTFQSGRGTYPQLDGRMEQERINKQKAAEEAAAKAAIDNARTAAEAMVDVFADELAAIAKTIELDFTKVDRADPNGYITKQLKDFNKQVNKLLGEYIEKYPDMSESLLEALKIEIQYAYEMLGDSLEDLVIQGKLRNAGLAKLDLDNVATRFIAELINELKPLTRTTLGTSTIRHKTFLPEDSANVYTNNIAAGNISADIVEAGIFDATRTAASGGDIAALKYGQSDYGLTPWDALISNMTKTYKEQEGISEAVQSIRSMVNMMRGNVAETVILAEAQRLLMNQGIEVTPGGIFYTEDKKLQAQLDGIMVKGNRFLGAIDAKAFNNMESLNKLIDEFTVTKGEFKVLFAKHFGKLEAINNDIAWQLAAQAVVTGKSSATLAILDTVAAGLADIDMKPLLAYDPRVPSQAKAMSKMIEQMEAQGLMDAYNADRIIDAITILQVNIPKAVMAQTKELAHLFHDVQVAISQAGLAGENVKTLLEPINQMGDKLGELTGARYTTDDYKPPRLGSDAATSMMSDAVKLLRSTNENMKALGEQGIDRIRTILEESVKGKRELDLVEANLGQIADGTPAIVEGTAHDVNNILQEVKDFQSKYATRDTTLTKQLNDLVRDVNRMAASNEEIRLNTVIGETADGKPRTFEDHLWSTFNTAKSLTGTASNPVSQAMLDMLDASGPLPVMNPFAFANLHQIVDTMNSLGVIDNLGNVAIADTDEALGIIARTIKLREAIEKMFKSSVLLNPEDGLAIYISQFGTSKFGIGKASPGMDIGQGMSGPMSEHARYFMRFGGGEDPTQGLHLNVKASTVKNAFELLRTAGATIKVLGDVTTRADIEQAYLRLIEDANIVDPMYTPYEVSRGTRAWGDHTTTSQRVDIPQSGIDFLLSTASWYRALGTRSGVTTTLSDYFDMDPAEQMFFGKQYITDAKWQEGSIIGTLLGRGKIGETLAETILANRPGRLGMRKLKDDELGTWLESQLGTGSKFDAVVDYIVRSGDTTSKTAQLFYNKYGQYMDDIIRPHFGMDADWMEATNMIINSPQVRQALDSMGYSGIRDASGIDISLKPFFDSILQDIHSDFKSGIFSELKALDWQQQGSVLQDMWIRAIDTSGLDGIPSSIKDLLSSSLGMTIKGINDQFGVLEIDTAKIAGDIIGWTQKLPESISLDAASLSATDIEILAKAGIQVNGDGSVTFMKAMNENVTGSQRQIELTLDDISKDVLSKLEAGGVQLNFSGDKTKLDLNVDTLSKQMTSALFRLNTDLRGQVSKDMHDALGGLGTVLESGYFEITNKAVLNGEITISEYIKSMGANANKLSPEVRKALEAIDEVIVQGADNTSTAVATWADAVVMKSPIDERQLTDELRAAFVAIGVTFESHGNDLMMIVNKLGEQVKNGLSFIPKDIWEKLNPEVEEALKGLGVVITEQGGFIGVDISNVLREALDFSDIDKDVLDALAKLGLAFETEGGKISGIISNLGIEIQDGVARIPVDILAANPDVARALEALGLTLVNTGDEIMVDFNKIMTSGVSEVIELYVNRPDLWDQIPTSVKEVLEEAGVVSESGMVRISTEMLDQLIQIGDQWVSNWSILEPEVIKQLGLTEAAAKTGYLGIKQAADDAEIGEHLDGSVVVPFSKLPKEIQDKLVGPGGVTEAMKGTKWQLQGTTQDTLNVLVEAVRSAFGGAVREAEDGAQAIAKAVSEAMREATLLEGISSKKQLNPFANKNIFRYEPIKKGGIITGYKVTYGGRIYTIDGATTEDQARDLFNKRYGIPTFKGGGLIETDGLYRAGEFGRIETVLPLENSRSMRLVGSAIASQMSPETFAPLAMAVGMQNAGVASPRANVQPAYEDNTDRIAQKVLEKVLPAMVPHSQVDALRPMFVGTLVADESGLRELNRKMRIINLEENSRTIGGGQ